VEPDKNKLYEMTGIGCDRSNNVTFYIFNTNNSKKWQIPSLKFIEVRQ